MTDQTALFEDLPPSYPTDPPLVDSDDEITSADETEIVNPPTKACRKCGLEVVRIPGTRGRLPAYHPECKPTGKSGNVIKTVRLSVAKAEQVKVEQVKLIVDRFARTLQKAVVMLSIADPYDAFVVHVNAPEVLDNLENLLMHNDKLRTLATTADTGGSIVGLTTALMSIGLPIAAHHGMLGKGQAASMILKAPMLMLRIQNAAENADGDFTSELLRRVEERAAMARARKLQEESTVRSSNGNAPPSTF